MFVACVGETTSTGVVHNCRIGEGRVDDCARHRFVIPVILQTGGSSVRVLEILFVVSCIHVFRSLTRQRSGILLLFVCVRPHTHTKSKGRRISTHASTHTQTSDARDDEIRCLLGFVREAQAPRISERQLHLKRSAVVATDATNMHAWSHAGCPQVHMHFSQVRRPAKSGADHADRGWSRTSCSAQVSHCFPLAQPTSSPFSCLLPDLPHVELKKKSSVTGLDRGVSPPQRASASGRARASTQWTGSVSNGQQSHEQGG